MADRIACADRRTKLLQTSKAFLCFNLQAQVQQEQQNRFVSTHWTTVHSLILKQEGERSSRAEAAMRRSSTATPAIRNPSTMLVVLLLLAASLLLPESATCQQERSVLENRRKHLASRRHDEVGEPRRVLPSLDVAASVVAIEEPSLQIQKRRGLGQPNELHQYYQHDSETRHRATEDEEDEVTVDFRLDELFPDAAKEEPEPAPSPPTIPTNSDNGNKQELLINRFISRSSVSNCERNLDRADADGNGRLDRQEYAGFLKLESAGAVDEPFGDLGAVFVALYYAVACNQCYEDTSGDDSCCVGENTSIGIPESSESNDDKWVLFLCSSVEEAIENVIAPQPKPTPAPLESPEPTAPPAAGLPTSSGNKPTEAPEAAPSPSSEPTPSPDKSPSREPMAAPSPTDEPTKMPVSEPSDDPTTSPSASPTITPSTESPTDRPSAQTRTPSPMSGPSGAPATTSQAPSSEPTSSPFVTDVPTTSSPSEAPAVTSLAPSSGPTGSPIATEAPTNGPSEAPTVTSPAPSSQLTSSPVVAEVPTSAPAATSSPVDAPNNNTMCVDFFYSVRNNAGLSAQDILDENNNTLRTGLEIATRNVTIDILNTTFPRRSRSLVNTAADASTAVAAAAAFRNGKHSRRELAGKVDTASAATSVFSAAHSPRASHATIKVSYDSHGLYALIQRGWERAMNNGLTFEFGDDEASMILRSLWDTIATSSTSARTLVASNDNRILIQEQGEMLKRRDSRQALQLSRQRRRKLVYYTDDWPPIVTDVIDDPYCPGGGDTIGGNGAGSNSTVRCAFVSTQVCVVLDSGDDPEVIERALEGGFRIAIQDGSFFDAIPPENIP